MSMGIPRLGIHYFPDDQHYRQDDLEAWLPALNSLGVRWITLPADRRRCVPEAFARGLLAAGIQPIIHLRDRVGRISEADLSPLLRSYARWGLRYLVLYDRPNMRSSWPSGDWSRRDLVERFVDHTLPLLTAIRAAGLIPVLPALEPGGDYWDTSFLEAALGSIERRGQRSLLRNLHLAAYAWSNERPLEWGAGGPQRWVEARPYHTPVGCQDQIGLRIFEWYSAICMKFLEAPLPQLVIAGGSVPRNRSSHYSSSQLEENLGIVRLLSGDSIQPELLAFNFYLLSSAPDSPERGAAWFAGPEQPGPMARAFEKLHAGGTPKAVEPEDKPIRHYVLLSLNSSDAIDRQWPTLGAIAKSARAVIGFSAEEARLARHVTLVGDVNQIPEQVARSLRASGCAVHRLPRGFSGPSSSREQATPERDTDIPVRQE